VLELAVVGGLVIDGTGAPPRPADVGIAGGIVREVRPPGELTDDAARTVEAHGCVVTPGFVDPHTHLDAQLCWDPDAAPTSVHGVTTVMIGLCGFGVAPAPPGGGEYLLRMLEAVEEIPADAARLGVDFTWGTWADYRRALRASVNVYGFVPHSALRYAVMGDRARGGPATDDDVTAMRRALADAMAAGALGLATSRGPNHVDGDGEPVPSRHATDDELRALVDVCTGRCWQINLASKMSADPSDLVAEVERYAEWTRAAGARLTWTPFHADAGSDRWRAILEHTRDLNARGIAVKPQVSVQPIAVAITFDRPSLLTRVPGWGTALAGFDALDPGGRRARLADEAVRRQMRAADGGAGPAGPLAPRYADWVLVSSPSAPWVVGTTVQGLADERDLHPLDALLDLVLADDLATVVQVPVVNRDRDAVRTLAADPDTVIGLGDSGAHVLSISNFSYPTELLTRFVRDDRALTVEQAVHRMTQQPAEFYGLGDRGVLAAGRPADVVVVDLARLALGPVELRHDLPGAAPRLWQGATGYVARVVDGVVRDAAP
jgi:N-acyl-D-aspartate/D-glutamate deacylase